MDVASDCVAIVIKISKKVFTIVLVGIIAILLIGIRISGMFTKLQPDQGGAKTVAETVGGFKATDQEICNENGKPIVYFFGSNACPHCRWEHPIVLDVVQQFSDYILFHDNMDSQNDADIYQKYKNQNSGYVPFLVAGCKYVKLGSGEQYGENLEKKYLTAIMCKLMGSSPELCKSSEIANLVSQIP